MTKIGFVIDCDGTLLDTETLWTAAERATVEHLGADWTADLKHRFIGRGLPETADVIAEYTATRASTEAVHRALRTNFDLQLRTGRIKPLAGARPLLAALADRGIPVAVASNSPFDQVHLALTSAGLAPAVATVVCASADLPPKPAPDLYRVACERLDVDPCRSAGIEDTQAGIDAIHAAGLLAISVPSPLAPTAGADIALTALWPIDLDQVLTTLTEH